MISTIVLSAFAVGIYGIYCYVTESNPYILYILLKYGDVGIVGGDEIGTASRGLSHRVRGNIGNPVYFAGILLLLICFCFIKIKKHSLSVFRYVTIILLTIALVFTGSRSSLGPLLLFLAIFLYRKISRKTFFTAVSIMLCVYLFLPLFSQYIELDNFLSSFDLSANRTDVGGSTFELRFSQLNGLLDIVGDNILFGNGTGFVADYVSKHGHHPILEGFESLIFSSFSDGGFWGLFIVYPFLFWSLYKYIVKFVKTGNTFFPKVFLFIFLIFSLLTGMYGFKIFIVLLLLIVNYDYDINKENGMLSSK